MQVRLLFLSIIIILSSKVFSQADSTTRLTHFSKGNFKVAYPLSWSIDTSGIMGTELMLFSPLENPSDKFRENVNVMIQNLAGQGIDLEKYKEITERQLKTIVIDGKIFESAIIKSGKEPFYKITYAMTQNDIRLKITSLCFIKEEKAFLATLTCAFDKYDQFKKSGEAILNSFSVK